jgi:hypothetical protein
MLHDFIGVCYKFVFSLDFSMMFTCLFKRKMLQRFFVIIICVCIEIGDDFYYK